MCVCVCVCGVHPSTVRPSTVSQSRSNPEHTQINISAPCININMSCYYLSSHVTRGIMSESDSHYHKTGILKSGPRDPLSCRVQL